jgi:signal transduction histidine kinase
MRWWLGLAFAAIAAITALFVAEVFDHRADAALRHRSEELAVGQSVSAGRAVAQALRQENLADAAALIADRRRISFFVFSPQGIPLTATTSRGVRFDSVPDGGRALRTALRGDRYVASLRGGNAFVVGLRLRGGSGAIVTYTPRDELRREFGLVRNELVDAALIAVAVGALVGLLVALLITARLRLIAGAAARIEAGAFEEPLRSRFNDELGALAETIDQMRQRLRESFGRLGEERDRLSQLLEGLQEGVVAVDRELRIAFANRAAHQLLPPRTFAVGAALPEPWPDFPLRAFVERLFNDDARPTQARVVEGDRTYALAGIPAHGGSDATLVVADISERERRERAEREFVANAAHELGTPLTAIATSLEVLQAGAKEDAGERDLFLELIERQTSRLTRLRLALLTLARAQTRQEPVQLEPILVTALLESVGAEVRAAHPHAHVVVESDDDLAVLAHRDLAEQVALNLAENAVRHGCHQVELRGRALDEQTVRIEVCDDGAGIGTAGRDRLFDRFYRGTERDGDGFGLGLAIVRDAVRALGGTVEIDSPAGGGTVVAVTLARAGAERQSGRLLPERPA